MSKNDYLLATRTLGEVALKNFGLEAMRCHPLWTKIPLVSHPIAGRAWDENESTNKKIDEFIKEQVAFSSWIIDKNKCVNILSFSASIPLEIKGKINTLNHENPLASRNFNIRSVVIPAMESDVKSAIRGLLEENIPIFWKLRLVKTNRFLVQGEFEDNENYETELRFTLKGTADLVLEEYKEQFKRARLTPPEIEIVAFNEKGEELK